VKFNIKKLISDDSIALKGFIHCIALILFIIAVAKLFSIFSVAQIWELPDPILSISNKWLFISSAGLDLGLSAFLLMSNRQTAKLIVLAWFATDVIIYRFGIRHVGGIYLLSCIGNITNKDLILPRALNVILWIFLCYILVVSYGVLAIKWLSRRRQISTEERSAHRVTIDFEPQR
jgi:hypothetical protein